MSDTFCSLPWEIIYTDPDGSVKSCCVGQRKLGNLNTHSIEEILHGPEFTKLRDDILNNKWSPNCSRCKIIENLGLKSERTERQVSKEFREQIYNNPTKFTFKQLEYRLDNNCNLSCIYCGSLHSSRWEKIENRVWEKVSKENILKFEKWVINNLDDLEELRLFGGEALLLKSTTAKVIEAVRDDILIVISSNLSIPNLEKNKIFNILKTKKNVHWQVSFENIGKQFEYVRDGASWETFDKNLKILTSYKQFTVKVSGTYNILAALNLKELYEYCSQYENIQFRWHGLVWPDVMNPYRYSEEIQNLCIQEIDYVLKNYTYPAHDNLEEFKSGFGKVIINNKFKEKLKELLLDKEKILSKPISYVKLWPHLVTDDPDHGTV